MNKEETVVHNTLIRLPGCRDWIRIDKVASLIILDLKNAGAEITWPEETPEPKVISKTDVAFSRLVEMDRLDRPLN